ncbi:MAG: FG-GAP-like repeat-containing protein [Phycisphaerales bacterium]
MTTHRPLPAAIAIAAPLLAAAASHAVTLDGIRFQDRNATGRTTLGAFRGSLAVIDFDNDGFMDLAIADVPNRPKRLFHNQPDPTNPAERTFVDRSIGSGLDDADSLSRGHGSVIVADIDNDGFQDLYFQGHAPDGSSGLLYRNNAGNGTFTNISIPAGVRVTGETQDSASFTDFDHDGYVDLFICNFIGPRTYRLFRNNGNLTFTSRPDLIPALPAAQRIYGNTWADFDADGWDDLFVIGSAVPSLLRSTGTGPARSLVDVAQTVGFTLLGPAPMGISAGDIDNDGDMDLSITDALIGTYYENRAGVMVRTTPFTTIFGWGTTWIDADNDGLLDNYQAGSWGRPELDRLHRNLGGAPGSLTWRDISAALNHTSQASQYCVQLDFNNDGRQDIVTVNPNNSVNIYENLSETSNRWLTVKVVGNATPGGTGTINRDAVGARVRVLSDGTWRTRAVQSGSSTASTEDLRAHFGLGPTDSIERIEIDWPVPADRGNGGRGTRTSVYPGPFAANSFITLTPRCTGDLNADAVVNTADLVRVLSRFGVATAPGAPIADADLNADGRTDTSDLLFMLSVFARACP